jgi:predicted Zn-dependent protease with MMP-like domain
MTIEEFEQLVDQAIKDIPDNFLKRLRNVEIIVEQEPSQEQKAKLKIRKNVLLFGLYEGVPQTKRWGYGQVLPDKITIFKKPIEQVAQSEQEIKEIVKETVWHEIAHHFGLDEEKVRQVAQKRKNNFKNE